MFSPMIREYFSFCINLDSLMRNSHDSFVLVSRIFLLIFILVTLDIYAIKFSRVLVLSYQLCNHHQRLIVPSCVKENFVFIIRFLLRQPSFVQYVLLLEKSTDERAEFPSPCNMCIECYAVPDQVAIGWQEL